MDTRVTALERSLNRTKALVECDLRHKIAAVEALLQQHGAMMQQHGVDIDALYSDAKKSEQALHHRINKECADLKNLVKTSIDELDSEMVKCLKRRDSKLTDMISSRQPVTTSTPMPVGHASSKSYAKQHSPMPFQLCALCLRWQADLPERIILQHIL